MWFHQEQAQCQVFHFPTTPLVLPVPGTIKQHKQANMGNQNQKALKVQATERYLEDERNSDLNTIDASNNENQNEVLICKTWFCL